MPKDDKPLPPILRELIANFESVGDLRFDPRDDDELVKSRARKADFWLRKFHPGRDKTFTSAFFEKLTRHDPRSARFLWRLLRAAGDEIEDACDVAVWAEIKRLRTQDH